MTLVRDRRLSLTGPTNVTEPAGATRYNVLPTQMNTPEVTVTSEAAAITPAPPNWLAAAAWYTALGLCMAQ